MCSSVGDDDIVLDSFLQYSLRSDIKSTEDRRHLFIERAVSCLTTVHRVATVKATEKILFLRAKAINTQQKMRLLHFSHYIEQ